MTPHCLIVVLTFINGLMQFANFWWSMDRDAKQNRDIVRTCVGIWILLICGIVALVGWLEWTAYFQRFPQADWWTFFVQ